jgi:hypothetical protein
MNARFALPLLLTLTFGIIGCTVTPTPQQTTPGSAQPQSGASADAKYIAEITAAPGSEHAAMAKRFLHSFDAGGLAMKGLEKELNRQAETQPSMAELTKRALIDIDADDFENLAARVYVRYLNQPQMAELAKFAESEVGGRFMRVSVAQATSGKKVDPQEIMNQFNADQLLFIMKFIQSEPFVAFQQKINIINEDLKKEGEKLGMATMNEYIRKQ